ncbi:hypothetical protein A8A03_26585 [Escherichia coli]|nr:hypothetical protein A8A03_26585 [Escherichia coli]
MSKHLATVERKKLPLTEEKNLQQNRAQFGRPSASTGWGEWIEQREKNSNNKQQIDTARWWGQ